MRTSVCSAVFWAEEGWRKGWKGSHTVLGGKYEVSSTPDTLELEPSREKPVLLFLALEEVEPWQWTFRVRPYLTEVCVGLLWEYIKLVLMSPRTAVLTPIESILSGMVQFGVGLRVQHTEAVYFQLCFLNIAAMFRRIPHIHNSSYLARFKYIFCS
jgi:hypothetical protein